jgi:hypothetical protein
MRGPFFFTRTQVSISSIVSSPILCRKKIAYRVFPGSVWLVIVHDKAST